MEALGILISFAIFGVVIYVAIESSRRWKEALRFVADELGLSFLEGGWLAKAEAKGSTDAGFVKVDSYTVSHGKSSTTYTRIVVDDADIPHDLILELEGVGSRFKKVFVGEDYELGVDAFDASIVVRGQPKMIITRLNASARDEIFSAVHSGIKIRDGKVTFIQSGLIRKPAELLARTEGCMNVARAIALGDETVPERLYATATEDPAPSVRQRAAAYLWNDHSGSLQAERLTQEALRVDDPWLRLMGAQRRSDHAGFQALVELARDGSLPNRLRTDAVRALIQGYREQPELSEHLQALVGRASASLFVATLDGLNQLKAAPPLASLQRRLQAVDGAGRAAVAELAALHGQAAALMLIDLLKDDDDDVQLAAVRALEKAGNLGAVEALLPLTKGVFKGGALKEAARAAVEAIQRRAGGGDRGSLSIAAEHEQAGGLSATSSDGGSGQLSNAEEPGREEAQASEPA